MIIAIDGPAGAGKTTTARGVADCLGYVYLETGAMYRAAALAFVRRRLPASEEAARQLMEDVRIDIEVEEERMRVLLDGENVLDQLRRREVTDLVSEVSALAEVRSRLVEEQRRIGRRLAREKDGIVAEGRDIGTVVYPQADVKIFMVADVEERARRRLNDLQESDSGLTLEEVAESIRARDRLDAERALAPLRKASDAVVIDTTGLSVGEQIEQVVAHVRERERV